MGKSFFLLAGKWVLHGTKSKDWEYLSISENTHIDEIRVIHR
jgi:hypothetical protein